MPELPEVEITARRLSTALEGAEVESALAPGVATLKTFSPSLDELVGMRVAGVNRRGKMLEVGFVTGDRVPPDRRLSLLVHLMSAGRLQLFEKRASLRDRRSRILVRLADGRELRLREFGTKQSAWAKLLARDAVDEGGDGRHARPGRLARAGRWRSSRGGSSSPGTSIPSSEINA